AKLGTAERAVLRDLSLSWAYVVDRSGKLAPGGQLEVVVKYGKTGLKSATAVKAALHGMLVMDLTRLGWSNPALVTFRLERSASTGALSGVGIDVRWIPGDGFRERPLKDIDLDACVGGAKMVGVNTGNNLLRAARTTYVQCGGDIDDTLVDAKVLRIAE